MTTTENTDTPSKVIPVDVEKLLFDLDNPRSPDLADQRSALHAFCIEPHAKKTVALAENIAEFGLNPAELLIVIAAERTRHYVVLEGNRRLAALKLLSNPARLADSPLSKPFQARLRKAAAKAAQNGLSKPQCRLLSTREQAHFWIALKHTGENDGVGVVQWDGEETARFRGSSPALQILDHVRLHAALTAEAHAGLERFPVTNLERLLGDPAVRSALGVALTDGTVLFTHTAPEVTKALARVIEDLARGTVTVTDIKLKGHRAAYLERIRGDLPKSAPLPLPTPMTDGANGRSEPPPAAAPTARPAAVSNRRVPPTRERKTLIPKACGIAISLPKVNDVFNELRTLPVEEFPNAASGLLRTLIDTTTQEYVVARKLTVQKNNLGQMELKPRIEAALQEFINRPAEREMAKTAKNALLQPSGAIPIEHLHFHVHGRFAHPIPDNLRKGWDMIEGWIRGMWIELVGLAKPPGNP